MFPQAIIHIKGVVIMKKSTTKILCVAFALAALSLPVHAKAPDGSVSEGMYISSQEISPRYKNIIAAIPIASTEGVGGILEAKRSMDLSISAKVYRNGKLIGSYGDSGYGTSLDFEELVTLKSGDVVKFVFDAGGEIQNATLTVSD